MTMAAKTFICFVQEFEMGVAVFIANLSGLTEKPGVQSVSASTASELGFRIGTHYRNETVKNFNFDVKEEITLLHPEETAMRMRAFEKDECDQFWEGVKKAVNVNRAARKEPAV